MSPATEECSLSVPAYFFDVQSEKARRQYKTVRDSSEADLISMLPLSIPPAAEFTPAKLKNIHKRKLDLAFQQR